MGGPVRGSAGSEGSSVTPAGGATAVLPDALTAAFDRLEGAISEVLDSEVDELTRPQLEATLRRLQPQLDRVHWFRSRLAGVLAEHARGRQGGAAAGHADERAQREATSFLRSELQLSDSEAKRAVTAGQQARTSPSVNQATRDGHLNPEQVATIAGLLTGVDPAVRAQLEAELLDAARRMDAVALGRFGRRRLLQLDPDEGERRERRQHERRAFRLTQTSDGAVIPSGRLYGAQAEVAMAAWHAFRRPDAPGEVRTPEQRGADAFEQLCAVALRAGEAPTQHGQRPQLLVVVEQEVLLAGQGVVEFGFTGPVSLRAVRCLLSDCTVSRIGLGDQPVSVSVSKKVRTVPAGLWRALVARDRGCTWRGCDAPAAWCDVAHGEQAYADDGHLAPANAALLCRRHHRAYDHGPYLMLIDSDGVRYVRDPDAEDRVVAMPVAGPGPVVIVLSEPVGEDEDRPVATSAQDAGSAETPANPGSDPPDATGSGLLPGAAPLDQRSLSIATARGPPALPADRCRIGPLPGPSGVAELPGRPDHRGECP